MWSIGTSILTIAVAAIHLGYTAADPVAGIASLTVLAGMLMFAFFIFRAGKAGQWREVLTPGQE